MALRTTGEHWERKSYLFMDYYTRHRMHVYGSQFCGLGLEWHIWMADRKFDGYFRGDRLLIPFHQLEHHLELHEDIELSWTKI